jgi:hypothetical protein
MLFPIFETQFLTLFPVFVKINLYVAHELIFLGLMYSDTSRVIKNTGGHCQKQLKRKEEWITGLPTYGIFPLKTQILGFFWPLGN